MRNVRRIIALGLTQGSGLFVRFALVAIVARVMSQGEFGRYSALWAVTAWTSVLAIGGWSSIALAQIPKSGITRFRYWRITRTVGARIIVVGLLQSVFVLFFLEGTTIWETLALSIGLAALSFGSLFSEVLRSQGAVILARACNTLVPPMLSLMLIWLLPGSQFAVVDILLIISAGWIVLAAMLTPLNLRRTDDTDDWYQQSSRVYTGIKLAQALLVTGDVLVVAMVADYESAASYAVASRVALLGGFALNVVVMLYGPRLSAVVRDGATLRDLTRKVTALSIALTVPVIAGLISLRAPILRAFGDDYAEASGLVVILVLATAISAIFGPVGTVLNVNGQELQYRRIMFVTVGAFLPLTIIFTSMWGVYGAAWSYFAATAAWNIAARLVVDYGNGGAWHA